MLKKTSLISISTFSTLTLLITSIVLVALCIVLSKHSLVHAETTSTTNSVAASDTRCTEDNYKSVASGCVTKAGKPCDPGSIYDSGCWLSQSSSSSSSSSTSTSGTGSSTASTPSAGASTTTAPTNNCKRSGDTGSDLNFYLDACGGRQEIRVNKARADSGEKVPAIVLVHGGGWATDDGNFSPSFQNRMAKWGFTTMRIKYRLMPGGVQEQLWDVQRAIRHVRENADKYGIDKNRIAVWGDSAGGSLAVRAGASGTTGVKAAVGWSAPTNAFRDLFNSYDGWVAGLYHSRCIGGQLPSYTNDVINAFSSGGALKAFDVVAKNFKPTPEQSARMLNNSLGLLNTSLKDFPGTDGKLQESASSTLGFTVDQSTISGASVGNKTDINTDALKQQMAQLTPSQLTALGISIFQFTQTARGISTQDPATAETLSTITSIANTLTELQKQNNQAAATNTSTSQTGSTNPSADSITSKIFSDTNTKEFQNAATSANQAGQIITDGANAFGINTQIVPAQKIADCIDDFIDLSPALFASPRSPNMFLVGGAKERWVNPLDAYQMRDKLRSLGKGGDALVLPHTTDGKIYRTNADGHMGYDQRAEVPTLTWLHNLLRSKTDAQRKADADKKAAAAAASR